MVNVELSINDLAVGYGAKRVIPGLSLAPLRGGQVVGLLGPNASGKSTMMKAAAGVQPTQAGRVSVQVDGQELGPRDARKAIGYVPQDLPKSAALTAFETVVVAGRRRLGSKLARYRAAEVMQELGIVELAGHYLSDLSGGQRQMVAVAQMLVTEPSVLLLDEPTSALDLHRQLFLLSDLRDRVRESGALAVVAIHDINLAARFCDELVVIKKGELQAQGAPGEVLHPALLQDVYGVTADVLQHDGVPVICAVG